MHHILYKDVYDAVLNSIWEKSRQIAENSQFFLDSMKSVFDLKTNKEREQMSKSIVKSEKRISDINLIIKKLYEDSCLGKLTDERFRLLSTDYENEQKSLQEQLALSRKEYATVTEKSEDISRFVAMIEKHKDIKELDETIIIDLIDRIVVRECEYIDGKRTQSIDIYYNFIGAA